MEARLIRLETRIIQLETRLNALEGGYSRNNTLLQEQQVKLVAAQQAAENAKKDAEWTRMLGGLGKDY